MAWLGELLGFAWEYTRRDPYDSSKGDLPTWTELGRFLRRLASRAMSIARHLRDRRA